MIRGNPLSDGGAGVLATDTVHLLPFTLEADECLVRAAMLLDGLGAGSGDALLRGTIYNADLELVAAGEEIVVSSGDPAAWRSLPFADAGLLLPPGDYRAGVHVGGVPNVAQGDTQPTPGIDRERYASPYADGPPAVLGAFAVTADSSLAMVVETVLPFAAPAASDDHLARLPFELAQRVFGATGPERDSRRFARAGWHNTMTDPETGANAIARAGGPLEELVGERLKVTRRMGTRDKVVYVYLHDVLEWPADITDEDFSLSARAWLELANPALESIETTVEVLL